MRASSGNYYNNPNLKFWVQTPEPIDLIKSLQKNKFLIIIMNLLIDLFNQNSLIIKIMS